jgi:hypothetical protein
MIDQKRFENGSNPRREREEAVLRGVNGWLEPSEPWLARRNGISSAFRNRHLGNLGQAGSTQYPITRKLMQGVETKGASECRRDVF